MHCRTVGNLIPLLLKVVLELTGLLCTTMLIAGNSPSEISFLNHFGVHTTNVHSFVSGYCLNKKRVVYTLGQAVCP